jgi:DNA-binding response OmpR family regulator
VRGAADGEAGLELAFSRQPDLILLDLMLPKVNGYEICRVLRENGLDVPIIMLTAKGQEEDIVLGLNLGADDYVTKPFKIRELVARGVSPAFRTKVQALNVSGGFVRVARIPPEASQRPSPGIWSSDNISQS